MDEEHAEPPTDEPTGAPTFPPRTIGIAFAALLAAYVVATAASIVGYFGSGRNSVVSFVAADVGLAVTLLFFCRRVSRRYGTGSLREDFGVSVQAIDVPLGIAAFLGATLVAGIIISPFVDADKPPTSNTDVMLDVGGGPVGLALVLVAAVLVAPLLEETFFRGFLLRALQSKLPPPLANIAQALVFALVHVDPNGQYDSLFVVIRAFVLGLVFGALAQQFRRLGPSMAGHVITNAAAMAIALGTG